MHSNQLYCYFVTLQSPQRFPELQNCSDLLEIGFTLPVETLSIVGDRRHIDGQDWIVGQTFHYEADNGTPFVVAICTETGIVPPREGWTDKVPVQFMMIGDGYPEEDIYLTHETEQLPRVGGSVENQPTWIIQRVQTFRIVGDRPDTEVEMIMLGYYVDLERLVAA